MKKLTFAGFLSINLLGLFATGLSIADERFSNGAAGFVYRYDTSAGETTWAWDDNNDLKFEKSKHIIRVPNEPGYAVFYWDWNQRGTPQAYAWAFNNEDNYFEKAWDADGDGFFESFCSYARDPGCVNWVAATTCDLEAMKQQHSKTYKDHIEAITTGNPLRVKRAHAEYIRATIVLHACKYRMSR